MQLARVKGEVVASAREPHLAGWRFRIILPVDEQDRPLGEPLVAVEVVASRVGDRVIWIDAREAGIEHPARFFEDAGVGLSNGVEFGGPGFVRLNFGCPRSLLLEALKRMETALRRLGRCHRGE